MKQLDVCWAAGQGLAGGRRLVVALQHSDIQALNAVIVAPLYDASELPLVERVRVAARLKSKQYVVAIDRLGSISKKQLGKPIGSLEAHRYDIFKALDFIFSGF